MSFQPAIRARIPFHLSSTNTTEKQTHAYTIWLNTLFTPVEFACATGVNQSTSHEETAMKTYKFLAELKRWYILRDHAREIFSRDLQSLVEKLTTDINQCRINPKAELNFSVRTVHRQTLLDFISSYNRIWFRLAMEVVFPVNIESYQQMKSVIDQFLIQPMSNPATASNEVPSKKAIFNNHNKSASAPIRLTIKNLIIIVIFLEHAKLLRLIDNDPCLYNYDAKFKSTKESIDILSRDFISSDTNLLRRLKLAGYEPVYKQTSLDEYNYLLTNNENKLFDDLKDGIRLTRCAQILLSSTNEYVARFDLSTKLKCPVVNLVHKLLNIDQAFELLQTYGHINLSGISNKDIMNGNKQSTLELLWRIFITCYLSKQLSPIERLHREISILRENLSNYCSSSSEQQLLTVDIVPLQKQCVNFTPIIHLLIKWVQLICAHYKFWLYDLQESFADGRALLFVISYYLPSLCDYKHDIKHLTTLATCQTRDEHIQFNIELGQQPSIAVYERNVKANFRRLEDCVKQFGTLPCELIKYEHYAKDVPDERCTIIILAMLAHDLLFSNNEHHHNPSDFRHQTIFQELKETYMNEDMIHVKVGDQQETYSSQVSVPFTVRPSIPKELYQPLQTISQSSLNTMNNDMLDRLDLSSDFEDENVLDSTGKNNRRQSLATAMATVSLHDFIELEKTIENEENRNPTRNSSMFLIDDTISSEIDPVDIHKPDEVSIADPMNRKVIREILTSFVLNEQQRIKTEASANTDKPTRAEYQSENERRTHAALVFQAHWRGKQVRANNITKRHPVAAILNRIHSQSANKNSSLTLRERLLRIVQEYSEVTTPSLSVYGNFLYDVEPLISNCLEIRHLITDHGLLNVFFVLMRCCNRSVSSTVLLDRVLNILQLFTVKQNLLVKLIDKPEHIKDFVLLLLKFYQNHGSELFERICFLLTTIINDEGARKILQSNKSFMESVGYVHKRLFNMISNENEKFHEHIRSTPKQPVPPTTNRTISLRKSSLLYPTPIMKRRSISTPNENILQRNLTAVELFMKDFYCQ